MYSLIVTVAERSYVLPTTCQWRIDAECLAQLWLSGDVSSVTVVDSLGFYGATFHNSKYQA